MPEIRHRKIKLAKLNMSCHYTHGVFDTSLVSMNACPDSFSPVRPGVEKVPLTRKDHVDGTLRNRLGLPKPANHFASKQLCQICESLRAIASKKQNHRLFRDRPRKRASSRRPAIPVVAHGDAMDNGLTRQLTRTSIIDTSAREMEKSG